ncbi:helix-turn-helix domain-containing protein [Dyadobacter psychrophilus]|uniref:DNA-binding transcriptional regulator, XRE-family HTH domain n=1 Tax=Dyadobacter psychrophilus TaxID=651661 RepID=A0A1T5CJD4_9BACT|nr:helix-turn-helix transcriptional regulator [Dyadobacter psychrophilus]SKB59270.1 DNA-binding transcriptional regulator, XRE-family HTH domain [Dyadobacter psychrophilus]
MPAFSEKIRAVRMMKGIKQSELACFLNVKQQSISKLENDKTNISDEIAAKIANYLGFRSKEEMEVFYEKHIHKHCLEKV